MGKIRKATSSIQMNQQRKNKDRTHGLLKFHQLLTISLNFYYRYYNSTCRHLIKIYFLIHCFHGEFLQKTIEFKYDTSILIIYIYMLFPKVTYMSASVKTLKWFFSTSDGKKWGGGFLTKTINYYNIELIIRPDRDSNSHSISGD